MCESARAKEVIAASDRSETKRKREKNKQNERERERERERKREREREREREAHTTQRHAPIRTPKHTHTHITRAYQFYAEQPPIVSSQFDFCLVR